MSIKRKLLNELSLAKKSILLLGPRQTGKSTLLRSLNPDLIVDLSDQEVFLEHASQPALIKALTTKSKLVLVDEVQRIPSLLNTIQSILDKNKGIRFLLSGSSARKLRRGQANLLPGRILTYELGPLTLSELGKSFDFKMAMTRGLLPGIYTESDERTALKTLKSYAATYLKEEIQAESLTRNLEGFSRFFRLIASLNGEFIDFTKYASLAEIERMSAKRYFEILVDTLVLTEVEPFAKSHRRRLIQHPRFYFFDVGALNGACDNFAITSEWIGRLFETLVLQLLISGAKSVDDSIRVSVYRTEANAEVDFILERKDEIFAIEVKATRKVSSSDLRGLKSFSEFYGKRHNSWLIYLGENELELNGVEVLPLPSALHRLGY